MALDKLVDSTQLDNNLTSVANAIRAKSGGTGQLAFPAGFVSEIGNISGGGKYPDSVVEMLLTGQFGSGEYIFPDITRISYAFRGISGECRLVFPDATGMIGANTFENSQLRAFFAPKVSLENNCFWATRKLVTAVIGGFGTKFNGFRNCDQLVSVDIQQSTQINNAWNTNCPLMATLVLRGRSLSTLVNTSAFDGTPFASGKSGGTIYIPKTLYDHLGDGSSLDYKAATNWSTIDGYGTITWAAIEGSIYETQYADGTAIT